MGLQPQKVSTSGGIPVWTNVFEVYTGGFTLVTTGLTSGAKIEAGTPVLVSETSRTATISKTARLYENAGNTDTTYKVYKGHHLAVGEYLAVTVGAKAYAISQIDTSNAAYDVLTVGTTLGEVITAGTALWKSSATGAAAAAIAVLPNGLVKDENVVGSYVGLNVVNRGTVRQRRIPALNTALKADMKNIVFSDSY